MDDIGKSQIGQRREVAYETDKHSKIPKTNLPPMRARGVDEPQPSSDTSDGVGLFVFVFVFLAIIFIWMLGMMFGLW